eukprot:COSAG01_NODE_12349_length_1754_cov_4.797086_1_plen_308_part_10
MAGGSQQAAPAARARAAQHQSSPATTATITSPPKARQRRQRCCCLRFHLAAVVMMLARSGLPVVVVASPRETTAAGDEAGVHDVVDALMRAPIPAPLVSADHGVDTAGELDDAQMLLRRGMEFFKRGRVADSIKDFDRVLELQPAQKPYMWQRGLSLFYAERLQDAAVQFEADVAVNPNDTEESIWRWLAMVRAARRQSHDSGGNADGDDVVDAAVRAARREMLQVGRDPRPVMRAAMELFTGEGAAAALDAAGGQRRPDSGSGSGGGAQAHDRFYADLYLALWHEAVGPTGDTAAKSWLAKAVTSSY